MSVTIFPVLQLTICGRRPGPETDLTSSYILTEDGAAGGAKTIHYNGRAITPRGQYLPIRVVLTNMVGSHLRTIDGRLMPSCVGQGWNGNFSHPF